MKLLVSALEHSANVHLKSLKDELSSDVEFIGIFDKNLGTPIIDLQSTAVMGYIDAIKKLRFYLNLAEQMVKLAKDADKVLLIDASGFNLPLAKRIKRKYPDKEIIYYILPEAWAWKRGRITKLEQRIDHLAAILPFESSFYSDDAPIQYVGHPLLDQITESNTSVSKQIKNITFMPGSRRSIIRKLMPVFDQVRQRIDAQFTIVIPKHFSKNEIDELYGDLTAYTVAHDTHKTLKNSDFAFICKGTATLEASLIGVPFVLVYKFASLDYIIFKLLVKIEYLGLGNILLKYAKNRSLHPELLQDNATAENLIEMMNSMDRDKFFDDSQVLRKYLRQGSAKTVASIIEDPITENPITEM